MKQHILSTNWYVKEREPQRALVEDFANMEGWLPATVPGTVHQDLLAAGRMPDPFIGLNENEVQWIGERDWLYRCQFTLPPDFASTETVALCFDGLDTFATVWLNGQQILVSDNMFIPQRVDVGGLLQAGENDLQILFESAVRIGKAREAEHGPLAVWNGDASRVYVRKAQYHYGWDWGPVLMTAGLWRTVWLEVYTARISDLHCPVTVADDLQSATLPVSVTVETGKGAPPELTLQLAVSDPLGNVIDAVTLPVASTNGGNGAGAVQHTFTVTVPQLWWPRGYGDQPLYHLEATLHQAEAELDVREVRLGLRRLQLRQEPLEKEPGTTFLFAINNTPIFCGGANWIPADSFLPRLTPEQYRAWVQLAADGNMVMLRIWGGGIYEDDAFYTACDELGLLVWQDFMFGCGIYPAYPEFQASVRAEAEAAVRRLRHHPCLALWAGNNEDYSIADSIGAYDITFAGDFTTTRFPARAIYERLLPEVCAALDPTRPYWPGSPYGGANPSDGTVGDRHTWDIWHGKMAPYQEYPKFSGRFVSEFGMQALPVRATIESFAPKAERYAESRTLDHHNKATDGPRRLAVYLNDTVRAPANLDDAIYATQLVQAEAVGAAIRGWRRLFGGPGHYAVAGALVWQINDCWPVTSWAVADYYLRTKPAYYVIKRELAPLVVGLAKAAQGAAVWAVNGMQHAVAATLELTLWTLDGAQVAQERRTVTLAPNQATALADFPFDVTVRVVLGARLLVNDIIFSRAALWPEPFKYVTFPDPDLEVTQEGDVLRLRVTRPAKGVWLTAGDGVTWSDNMLDLLPEDEQTITADGLAGRLVHTRWLH
ncbi:MAG: glycoside hydrolase family 2 protein [Caldilineaceae bacterium]